MAVAIHSTRLGPALGGARLWHYERDDDGVADALRLAEAMTYKAAAAGLDLGGGKGVICAPSSEPPEGELRRAILHDFGDLVESLGGRYITAEDVGTATEDMVEIATRTTHVTGMPVERGGAGDPSPFTALGVQAAMRAACRRAFGTSDLARPERRRRRAGPRRRPARSRPGRRGRRADALRHRPGQAGDRRRARGRLAAPDEAVVAARDVVAPCAVGGAIHDGNVGRPALPRRLRRREQPARRREPRAAPRPSAGSSTRPTSSRTRAASSTSTASCTATTRTGRWTWC